MNKPARNSRLLIIVVLLTTLSWAQLVHAEGSRDCTARVPQWVFDRQQYETSYVYAPMAATVQPSRIPQWVLDRQQYETSYVYGPAANDLRLAESVSGIPQWVLDRQQYETNYYAYIQIITAWQPTDDLC